MLRNWHPQNWGIWVLGCWHFLVVWVPISNTTWLWGTDIPYLTLPHALLFKGMLRVGGGMWGAVNMSAPCPGL